MAEQKPKSTEEQVTAYSYIINFYNQIIYLNNQYAVYYNLVLELEYKYGGKTPSEEDKSVLDKAAQDTRYSVIQSYIIYSSIKDHLKEKIDIDVDAVYKELTNVKKFIIVREDLFNYVIAMNKILSDNVMRELLRSSQDVVRGLV